MAFTPKAPYATEKRLASHINVIHVKSYTKVCDKCGKSMVCGKTFERHMLEHEGKSLPKVKCNICGKILATDVILRRHQKMQHPVDGKKEYICSICCHISTNKNALNNHMHDTHPKTLYNCTMCGRVFKKKIRLKEHMATHTGIALYTCSWCPKTFNASGGMHAHRKRMHPIEFEETRRQKHLELYKTLDNYNPHDKFKPLDITEIQNI